MVYPIEVDSEFFLPFLIFSIPIIAIVGGITAGIVKTLGQQRLLELAQRERIAAIERGIDPSKLPPLPTGRPDDELASIYLSPRESAKRRAQGLMIGGLVTLAVGLSLSVFLGAIAASEGDGQPIWAVGLIPTAVGIALLISAWLVRPTGNGTPPPGPHSQG